MKMGLTWPELISIPPPPSWQHPTEQTSGQQRLLPLAERGLSLAEETLASCFAAPQTGGRGAALSAYETREGPLQLSSSGVAQGAPPRGSQWVENLDGARVLGG